MLGRAGRRAAPGTADLELYRQGLRRLGLRHSRTRDEIVEIFLSSGGHWSPEELYGEVRRRRPGVGVSTVYRTLRSLLDIGLAREVDLGDGLHRYERSTNFPNHYHLVCAKCHAITEFLANAIEEHVKAISSSYAFSPTGHVLKVDGICSRCRGGEAESPVVAVEHDLVLRRDSLAAVIDVERMGHAFYARRMSSVGAELRELWRSLQDEEAEHLEIMQRELNDLIKANPHIRKAPRILHHTLPWEERKGTVQAQSEEEIILDAIEWERTTARYFKAQSDNLPPCPAKEVFARFAEAEKVHLILLQAQYNRRLGRGLPYPEGQF